jgi:CRISPR/Cas system Type II protein with McrA/HNH and RuvC-like nuclease domain
MSSKFIKLNTVLNDTTNSYKLYWFLAIIEEIKENNNSSIEIEILLKRMVNYFWYPIDVFKLSFGKQDSFHKLHKLIKEIILIDNSPTSEFPIIQIETKLDNRKREIIYKEVKKLLGIYVPYRFLSPFFKDELNGIKDDLKNKKIIELSSKENIAPYFFENNFIHIHPEWKEYLNDNIFFMENYIKYYLILFLEKNNPSVSSISRKLWKPKSRKLNIQIKAWKLFISKNPNQICIYSGEKLSQEISLDHFIPWSVATHDLNWNLIPTSRNVNSKKSDNLPSLDCYLNEFLNMQFTFFKFQINQITGKALIEEYCNEFKMSAEEINCLSKEEFKIKLKGILLPMFQNASNRGFHSDWVLKNIN